MSKVEIIAEIPKLSHADRREIVRLIMQLEQDAETVAECDRLAGEKSEGVPAFADRYREFLGMADDLPPDLAGNLDHYVHGHPKR